TLPDIPEDTLTQVEHLSFAKKQGSKRSWTVIYSWMMGSPEGCFEILAEESCGETILEKLNDPLNPYSKILSAIHGSLMGYPLLCEIVDENNDGEKCEWSLRIKGHLPRGKDIRNPERFLALLARQCNKALA
ncbi:MAG: hypothetical protein K0S20_620, partial [Patescibacteria group bacterium]|nr:hypothetical protein [Patescibacteria group bacterium]